MSVLQIDLVGPLRVTCGERGDVTPNGRRAQGIVAMLALSPARERGRAWLQAKLWSDRSTGQASASLRQELSRLRRTLGAEHVVSDYQRVRLAGVRTDVSAVAETGVLHRSAGAGEPPDLLEGLEVNDPEFEEWLRLERSHWHDLVAAAARRARQVQVVSWRGNPARSREDALEPANLQRPWNPTLTRRKNVAAHTGLRKANGSVRTIGSQGIEILGDGRSLREVAANAVPLPLPADLGPDPGDDKIEIVLANGRRIIASADVDAAALARVLSILAGS